MQLELSSGQRANYAPKRKIEKSVKRGLFNAKPIREDCGQDASASFCFFGQFKGYFSIKCDKGGTLALVAVRPVTSGESIFIQRAAGANGPGYGDRSDEVIQNGAGLISYLDEMSRAGKPVAQHKTMPFYFVGSVGEDDDREEQEIVRTPRRMGHSEVYTRQTKEILAEAAMLERIYAVKERNAHVDMKEVIEDALQKDADDKQDDLEQREYLSEPELEVLAQESDSGQQQESDMEMEETDSGEQSSDMEVEAQSLRRVSKWGRWAQSLERDIRWRRKNQTRKKLVICDGIGGSEF